MVRNRPTSPRKRPVQSRSMETVDVILKATAHILVSHGFARTSTNRVARRAGVSIGSIYQYFPSKEARVAELVERHLAMRRGLVLTHLARSEPRTLSEQVRGFISALMQAQAANVPLQRAIMEQVPRVLGMDRVLAYEWEMVDLVRAALEGRRSEVQCEDVETMAFVLTHAVHATTLAALADPAADMDGDTLLNALVQLVLRTLGAQPDNAAIKPRRWPS